MKTKFISEKEYAKSKGLPLAKVKKMAPYQQGAFQCAYCKKWHIPEDATPIYIPDKRFYSKRAKKYCYVMDAICEGTILDNRVDGCTITDDECRTIVKQLRVHEKIILKEGCQSDSLWYRDYFPSMGVWDKLRPAEKTDLITKILDTVKETLNLAHKAL